MYTVIFYCETKKVAIEINILPTWKLAWQNVYKSPVIPIIVTAAGKHNIQYCTFKRGFLKNSNALQKSYRDTWHSIIRASAKCISWTVKAKVGSTGVAGHKPCNSRLSATVWHAQQIREILWWRPKCKENRIEMFKIKTNYLLFHLDLF